MSAKKATPKIPVRGGMRVKTYTVLERCIEVGVKRGWRTANQHEAAPSDETVQEYIKEAVAEQICEAFAFDDESPAL